MSSIAEDTMSCLTELKALAATLPATPEEYRVEMSVRRVIDERDRLKIWAGSLGALQIGTKALTFRLRESPIMETNVKKLLRRLVDILTECLKITTGVRAPLETNGIPNLSKDSEYLSDSDSDDDSPKTELGQQMMSITSVLSDLYKIAFKIRNRATRPISHKPAVYDETVQIDDNTRVSVFASYEKCDRQFVEDSLLHLRKHFTMKPYQDSTNRTSQERPQYTDNLAERLAKITTTRRRILRYWQRHAEKLANVGEEKGNEEITQLQEAVNRDSRTITSGSEHPTITGTEATTYDPRHDSTQDTVSVISFASTSFDMEGNTIEISPMPSSLLQLPGFVCPYCGILIPSREGTGRAWKNHVLTDLMPYFCTYAECPDEMRMYGSRHDWIEHEKAAHLKEWRCFDHTETPFKSTSELRRHLEVEHCTSVSQFQIQTLVDLGERNAPDTRTMCPICYIQGPFSKGLTNHIAFHLEKFALFSIKGHFFETQADSDEDDDSKAVHDHGSSIASDKSNISFAPDVGQSEEFNTHQSADSTASSSDIKSDRPNSYSLPYSPLLISNSETRNIDPRAFIFQIDEIGESPDAAMCFDSVGHWVPSTDPGANIRVGGGISGTYWYCDGQQLYQIPGLFSSFSKYSTHSMYFSGGYGFYIMGQDLTTGTDMETDSWRPLRFDHDENNYSSFLSSAGQHSQLRVQRDDQIWTRVLLPDIYHSPARTQDPNYGGLIGELGILLALIALSTSREYLPDILPTMYSEGSWKVHEYYSGRMDGRGVVVEVWASDPSTLEHMENGDFGSYYN